LGIPEAALQPGTQVYTVADGKLKIHRHLSVARVLDGVVWLRPDDGSTLAAGQDVVVSQLPLAVDGMDVRVE
jgi:hypothetical protein